MAKKFDWLFYLKVTGALVLVSLPFLLTFAYQSFVTADPILRFAGGLPGGKYDEFTRKFAKSLQARPTFKEVTTHSSTGSYDSLKMLKENEVDFALFQAGSDSESDLEEHHDEIAFVSNVFPEVAHLVVSGDLEPDAIAALNFSKIAVGVPASGDFRVGTALIEHLRLTGESVQVTSMTYDEVLLGFENRKIELAILNVGIGTNIVDRLIREVGCKVIDVPFRDKFLAEHVAYSPYTIPAGTFLTDDIQTLAPIESVAVNAQLITRKDVKSQTVIEVLNALNQSKFLKKQGMTDLFRKGKSYAVHLPEFDLHSGAENYFNPGIRPLINPDFVEATEGIRSFVVSGLIGLFLLIRWIRIRNERSQSHKLDQFIHRLLEIEKEQIEFDRDYTESQLQMMEGFLDEITSLRQEALREFSAHDLNDDPAIECFINMSHALSEKINMKLTRDVLRKK